MSKLSFKKAAEKILSNSEEPLTAQEITDLALESGILKTSGMTPVATMAAQLYTDINNNKSSKFKKIGKGLFSLKRQTESANSPLLAVENQNQLVRKKLIDKIQSMDPFLFEVFIAELLKKIGYENVEVTKKSGDKGIDVIAKLTVDGLTNVKTVIQVKRYKTGNNISGKYITQLRGSAEVDQRGLIITTSDFTRDAINESTAVNKMPVALVNGEKLLDLLFKYKVGVKEQMVSVYSLDTEMLENEVFDEKSKLSSSKNKSIWPLPGGVDSYISSLNEFLDKVKAKPSKKKDLVQWFTKHFENVNSEKTANGYLNVPKNMGLIYFRNGFCYLTDSGSQYLESKKLDLLFQTISNNILAFEEVYEFIKNSSDEKSEQDILEYVTDNFDVDWTTYMQVNYRLYWLTVLGKIKKLDDGYVAIE